MLQPPTAPRAVLLLSLRAAAFLFVRGKRFQSRVMNHRLSFFSPLLLIAATFGCATVASPEDSLTTGGLPDIGGGGAAPLGSGGSSSLVGSGTGGADSGLDDPAPASGGGEAMGSGGGDTVGGSACAAGCKAWSEFDWNTSPAVGACITGMDGNYTYEGGKDVYQTACGPPGERDDWCDGTAGSTPENTFTPCN